MRTYIYVDGFNLYYRAVRGTPYKWLDIDALCRHLLQPENQILCIKYFTAHISPTSQDPTQHVRQQMYLRALRTLPHLQVIPGYGRNLTNLYQTPNLSIKARFRAFAVDGSSPVGVSSTMYPS